MEKSPVELLSIVCEVLKANENQIKGNCREGQYVSIRHIYSYIAKEYFYFTLKQIGDTLGGRDHSTIYHSINCIKIKLELKDEKYITKISDVLTKLGIDFEVKKTEKNMLLSLVDLTSKYNSLRKEYALLNSENTFLKKKISNLETQNRLYKIHR
jgi:hypothetical protein